MNEYKRINKEREILIANIKNHANKCITWDFIINQMWMSCGSIFKSTCIMLRDQIVKMSRWKGIDYEYFLNEKKLAWSELESGSKDLKLDTKLIL